MKAGGGRGISSIRIVHKQGKEMGITKGERPDQEIVRSHLSPARTRAVQVAHFVVTTAL